MKKTLLFASLLALAGASSVAAAADNSWYVRGELGQSNISSNAFVGSSNSDTSGSLRAGYYFNPHIAVEGFYANYGNRTDAFGDKLSVDGWGVGVVAKQNFGADNTGFFIQGRAGISRLHGSLDTLGVNVWSSNKTKGYLGVGGGYDFNPNVGIGVNYDYTPAGSNGFSGHISTWTGGVEVRF